MIKSQDNWRTTVYTTNSAIHKLQLILIDFAMFFNLLLAGHVIKSSLLGKI